MNINERLQKIGLKHGISTPKFPQGSFVYWQISESEYNDNSTLTPAVAGWEQNTLNIDYWDDSCELENDDSEIEDFYDEDRILFQGMGEILSGTVNLDQSYYSENPDQLMSYGGLYAQDANLFRYSWSSCVLGPGWCYLLRDYETGEISWFNENQLAMCGEFEETSDSQDFSGQTLSGQALVELSTLRIHLDSTLSRATVADFILNNPQVIKALIGDSPLVALWGQHQKDPVKTHYLLFQMGLILDRNQNFPVTDSISNDEAFMVDSFSDTSDLPELMADSTQSLQLESFEEAEQPLPLPFDIYATELFLESRQELPAIQPEVLPPERLQSDISLDIDSLLEEVKQESSYVVSEGNPQNPDYQLSDEDFDLLLESMQNPNNDLPRLLPGA